ncbi:MAG: hypothetical protein V1753_00700 [Pseudomonadota bacterium]
MKLLWFGVSSAQMMTGVAVVLFDSCCVGLTNDMALLWKNFCKSIPIVSEKYTFGQVVDFVIESLEDCSITTANNPGNSSPCATIQRFDDTFFVFFDPTKCHISSNSISLMSPETLGSGRRIAS